MPKRDTILLSTLFGWLIGCGVWAYFWVAACNADPSAAAYEKGLFLPLLGFLFYSFTFLLAGFVIIFFAELMFIPHPQNEKPTMV
jgi:hypothetical protein